MKSFRSASLAALIIAGSLSVQVAAVLSVSEMEEIFILYDVPEEENEDGPDCQSEAVDNDICPSDEKLPCGPVENIEAYCETLLGADIVNKCKAMPEDLKQGKNALAGCVKYIGFHVFDLDHMACCDSAVCEDWIGDQFELYSKSKMEAGTSEYDDEDEEDDDDDDEYDGFGDEF